MSDNSYIKERNKRYDKYVKAVSPSTSSLKSLLNSFWIGGLTCLIGEGLGDLYALIFPELSVDMVGNLTSMTLIALAIFFTGLGFYDAIGRRGGAGSFLPITGFANAMSSAAMEFKSEGIIFGTSFWIGAMGVFMSCLALTFCEKWGSSLRASREFR